MKFNRKKLEELTLEKIDEVNDEISLLMEEVEELHSKLEAWQKCADHLFVYAMETLSTATSMALYEAAKEDVLEYNRLKMNQNLMNNIPQGAYILPDEKTGYIAVWQDDKLLKVSADGIVVKLDKQILPHLVDALIDLQNT